MDTIDSLYQKYNLFIDENEYGIKYDIPHAHMFVVEGMDKAREVIEKNRKSSSYMKNSAGNALWDTKNVLRSWEKTGTAIPKQKNGKHVFIIEDTGKVLQHENAGV